MKSYLITPLILLALYFSCSAQETTPDYGALLVAGINSGSEAGYRESVAKVFSAQALAETGAERLAGFLQRMHDNFAPLEYHHSDISTFEKPDGKVMVMHVFCRKEGALMWTDIQLYLDTNPPHKLYRPAFVAEVTEPINLPNGGIDQPATLQWLNDYTDKLQREYDLSGSYLITQENQVLYQRQLGFADPDRREPISEKTLFNIASGGKMFTAVAIAQLKEAGKLQYEDAITQYLSGFADAEKASRVNIHHLLSHTSGISEYWSGQNDEAVYQATSIADHLRLVYQAGFDFAPGEQYQYCNSNFILLGAIIEKITRQSYYDYVQQNIFDPAGMTASGYFHYGTEGLAIPLARGKDPKAWQTARHGVRGSSAGGAYSNAEDILKFSRALREEVLLPAAAFRQMVISKTDGEDTSETYGYGFILSPTPMETAYGHGGITAGVNFEFRYFPRQDVTLILFCNQDNGAYDDLKKNAIKLITGQR